MLCIQHGDARESSGIVILKRTVRFETCGNYLTPNPLWITFRESRAAPATSRRGRKICFFPDDAVKTAPHAPPAPATMALKCSSS